MSKKQAGYPLSRSCSVITRLRGFCAIPRYLASAVPHKVRFM